MVQERAYPASRIPHPLSLIPYMRCSSSTYVVQSYWTLALAAGVGPQRVPPRGRQRCKPLHMLHMRPGVFIENEYLLISC